MKDLISGRTSLKDPDLQSNLLDWMSCKEYNHFRNKESGEDHYALSSKRGNRVYAAKKNDQRKALQKALDGKEFDFPVKHSRTRRMTRMLFVTVNFDREQFTMEEAWASLRSTGIDGFGYRYGVINSLEANLRSIFGPHGKLVAKEAQEGGYPAPHMILVLDSPVEVELVGRGSDASWRLRDERILRRIGKDPALRSLSFRDYRSAIRLNPIWKHGFIDFEGIVKGDVFRHKKDAISYPFKYLVKSLTDDSSMSIEDLVCIDDTDSKALKTALYTHLCNKCFRMRDISFGAGFKKRIEYIQSEKPETSSWVRIRTLLESEYLDRMYHDIHRSDSDLETKRD